jgi:hypothetical protein
VDSVSPHPKEKKSNITGPEFLTLVTKDYGLVRHDAVWSDRLLSTFRKTLLPPSSADHRNMWYGCKEL